MRIAIDGSAIPKQMAGAGVYTHQLVRALADVAGDHEIVVFTRPELFDDLAGRLQVVHVAPRSPPLRLAWEQALLPRTLRRLRIDVLHSPHHHTPIATRTPQVVTFHDVTFLLLPERYPRARRLYMSLVTRAAARVAKAIITPSETVRRDVLRTLRLPPERVVAIPEAAGPQYAPAGDDAQGDVRATYGLSGPYVLSVGSREPGKNRARLFEACGRLRAEGLDFTLAVAGQPAWRYEEEASVAERLGLAGRVRFLGYVPDGNLPALYSAATAFAFPSLYEGFGLPVLEAMACGTPVVTSTGSAPAEVAGDAALLIDPVDVGALAEALRRLLQDESLRGDLRARGLQRARQFSWRRTAEETLAVYRSAATG